MIAGMAFEGGYSHTRNECRLTGYGFRVAIRLGGGHRAFAATPHDGLKAFGFQSIQMGALLPNPRRGHPGPRASSKEGGRILGPLGKSVWCACRPSRVKMNGCAALDSRHAHLIKRSFVNGKEVCLSTLFFYEATNSISTLFNYEAPRATACTIIFFNA